MKKQRLTKVYQIHTDKSNLTYIANLMWKYKCTGSSYPSKTDFITAELWMDGTIKEELALEKELIAKDLKWFKFQCLKAHL